jgi:hypothetical protein
MQAQRDNTEALLADIDAREARDTRTALSRPECCGEGNWSPASQAKKENSGALHSFLDGKKRLISAKSFYQHLRDRILQSQGRKGQAPTSTSFKKKRRTPSENELRGLAQGNARRAEEARERREAKAASA